MTAHPTAEWTVQQFRTCVMGETTHCMVVHDRDSIYSAAMDGALHAMGLRVLKTPVAAPQANAYCERVIGTGRRECLDWINLLDERHLRRVLTEWVAHCNRGRPHAALGRFRQTVWAHFWAQAARYSLGPFRKRKESEARRRFF